MTEHRPWIGDDYTAGMYGQRLCIVGYSHWHNEGDNDEAGMSEFVVGKVVDGSFRIPFFSAVRNYFNEANNTGFWSRVMFFNYLPSVVGSEVDRYGYGTPEQHERARVRTLELIARHQPDKVFLFSTKGWWSLKQGLIAQGSEIETTSPATANVELASVVTGSHETLIAGLRHPQGANGGAMRSAVRHVLDRPNRDASAL